MKRLLILNRFAILIGIVVPPIQLFVGISTVGHTFKTSDPSHYNWSFLVFQWFQMLLNLVGIWYSYQPIRLSSVTPSDSFLIRENSNQSVGAATPRRIPTGTKIVSSPLISPTAPPTSTSSLSAKFIWVEAEKANTGVDINNSAEESSKPQTQSQHSLEHNTIIDDQ